MNDEFLSPAEIEALLGSSVAAAVQPTDAAAERRAAANSLECGISPEDRASRESLVIEGNDELRQSPFERRRRNRIWAIHEQASREIGATLSAMLSTPVDVRLRGIDHARSKDLEQALSTSVGSIALRSTAIPGCLAIDFDASLLHAMLGRMVGSDEESKPSDERPLSGVERQLMMRVVGAMADQISHSWETTCSLALRIDRGEIGPHSISLGPPESTTLVVAFDARMGANRGEIHFFIPPQLSDLLDEHIAASEHAARALPIRNTDPLATNFEAAEFTVELSATSLAPAEVAALSPRDVITTNQPIDEPVRIHIDGEPGMLGELAATAGRKAVRILGTRHTLSE